MAGGVLKSGPGSLNAVWLTPSFSTIFLLQLLVASHSLALEGSGGRTPQFECLVQVFWFSEPGIQ